MLLEALVRRYESQAEKGDAPRQGWSKADVSFALRIDENGKLVGVIDLRWDELRGKKTVRVPSQISVPEPAKRTSGISPQFLCDNSSYFLGIDNKGNSERSKKCFLSASEYHQEILKDCHSNVSEAVKDFFSTWDPDTAEVNDELGEVIEEIKSGRNLIFMVDETFAQDDPEVKEAWETHRQNAEASILMQCLVTGRKSPIARLHPALKGVRNAQSSGASLVSFNAPAYDSYGHDEGQGLNAPVSEYAAFAYGTALNQLLSDKQHTKMIGDTTIVYWAEKDSEVYQDVFSILMGPDNPGMDDAQLDAFFSNLVHQKEIDWRGLTLDFNNRFYILGLAPNAARLSVRFFLQGTFGEMVSNMAAHEADMELVRPPGKWRYIPLWAILQATVSPKATDKTPSPLMSGSTFQSIFLNRPYPVSLYQNVLLRIKAEQDEKDAKPPHYKITYERVAIIKAYLKRNKKWGITVALDENSTDAAYVLGRLFAVWEHIQEDANPGLNTTIKDRYFNAACATPARIFPILQKLAGHHLRKLKPNKKVYFEKTLTDLIGKLDGSAKLPNVLPLDQQGLFVLGYYHQTQARYTKKEEKENG